MNLDFLKGIVPCDTSYAENACTICDFYVLIQNIINFFLYVAAPLVTLGAIYIAFLFMFSGGSSSKITEAKDKLWLLLWGIFWIFGSWLVLNSILNIVANKSVFPWPWNQITCEVSKPSILISPPAGQIIPVPQEIPEQARMSEQEARNQFQQAGITINKGACPSGVSYQNVSGGCTSLTGVTATTLLEAVQLKNDCKCNIQITGGTEQGHAQGTLSHANGDKLDFQPNSTLDNYIQNNFIPVKDRSDGTKQYRAPDGSVYARESDHWDVTFAQ